MTPSLSGQAKKKGKPKHRMYCVQSLMRCAVIHTDGICPDVRDCEGCKAENPNPQNKHTWIGNQTHDSKYCNACLKEEVKKCEECGAFYTGIHTCPKWMLELKKSK